MSAPGANSNPPLTADLFGGLQVRTPDQDLPATRVDVGWRAWQAALAPDAGRRQRLRFWLALGRHVGRARYFVQVDQEYRAATSVSVLPRAGSADLEVRLQQTATPWQWLWQRLRAANAGYQTLHGRQVRIARLPEHAPAQLPDLPPDTLGARCAEAMLDGLRGCSLPLTVSAR